MQYLPSTVDGGFDSKDIPNSTTHRWKRKQKELVESQRQGDVMEGNDTASDDEHVAHIALESTPSPGLLSIMSMTVPIDPTGNANEAMQVETNIGLHSQISGTDLTSDDEFIDIAEEIPG